MTVKQYSYKGEGNSNESLSFSGFNTQVLGIQTIPGLCFYINNIQENVMVIGRAGVYEVDLRGTNNYITSISFPKFSKQLLDKNENNYLIIDLINEEAD